VNIWFLPPKRILNSKSYRDGRTEGSEIRSLPEEALPKVMRLISLVKEDLLSEEDDSETRGKEINHEKTRNLLSSSATNWAHSIIADREDRI